MLKILKTQQIRYLLENKSQMVFSSSSISSLHPLRYMRNSSLLTTSQISLSYLVPNIFSSSLLIHQYPKLPCIDNQNYFQNSYISIDLKIQQQQELKSMLMKFTKKHVRIGRLLEIMDMIAGLVSYTHAKGNFKNYNPFTMVTGAVQNFQLFQSINCEHNIMIEGFLNYVGKTSMEVEVNIHQNNKLKGSSYFTMISRDSSNLLKGYQVPRLDLSNLNKQQLRKAQLRKQGSLSHIKTRHKQLSQSFSIRPPSPEQISQIHFLFLQKSNHPIQNNSLYSTRIQNNLVMQPQDRNVHNKIFGGYLMREMLQIGWFAGIKFLKGQEFQIQGITDFYFLSPVEIGDGLNIIAQVTYTHNNIVIVTVQAHTINFKTEHKKLCCSSQIILKTKSQSVKKVYPDSYSEALKYLVSHRTYRKLEENGSLTN